jgi:hypothetical protein
MPSNLVMCVKNAIDYATLAASPALISTMPEGHLRLPARGRVARSTSAAAQEISFTWGGQGYYLNFLTLMRHNLEPAATMRVQLFATASFTTQIYDSGNVAAYSAATLGDLDFGVDPLGSGVFDGFLGQRFSTFYFTRVLALSGKITITDTGNSASYVEASRLYAGDATEFTYNPNASRFGWKDNTEQSRGAGGSLRSDAGISFRKLDLTMAWVSASQRNQLADMLRFAGRRKDIFLSLYPSVGGEKERDYTMLAKFVSDMPDISETGGITDLVNTQFSFEEI